MARIKKVNATRSHRMPKCFWDLFCGLTCCPDVKKVSQTRFIEEKGVAGKVVNVQWITKTKKGNPYLRLRANSGRTLQYFNIIIKESGIDFIGDICNNSRFKITFNPQVEQYFKNLGVSNNSCYLN